MRSAVVFRVLGVLLTLFSVSMLVPAGVSLLYRDGTATAFLLAFAITLVTGLVCWLPTRKQRAELRIRDGFLVTVLFWAVLGFYGSFPLMLSDQPELSFTDAVFESLSGLTTTGATVIQGLDDLPRSVLLYRQQLQWLGGMGIIVLAIAVLPMLGIGGMQLFRAEITGPIKDSKLTPRITQTAKALWYIYLSLTVACALAYWLAGMEPFDAIAHSFSTVAIGGFSTHDASIGFFNSQAIELVTVFFIVAVRHQLHAALLRLSSAVAASVSHRPRMPHLPSHFANHHPNRLWLILFTHNEHDAIASPCATASSPPCPLSLPPGSALPTIRSCPAYCRFCCSSARLPVAVPAQRQGALK